MKKCFTILYVIFVGVILADAHPLIHDITDQEERLYTLRPVGYGSTGWNATQAYEDEDWAHSTRNGS